MKLAVGIAVFCWLFCGLLGAWMLDDLNADHWKKIARGLSAIHADFASTRPEATWLSAGMSADLEAAIRAGATHVRVGSAVLGERRRNE